ncbi:MAG: hypothetical protein EPO25_15430 [Gammaproteobacteria bacterium]|nr:MAG: hypothetical protein EPO25_15430 [Gammaproteobacteria bacterium]
MKTNYLLVDFENVQPRNLTLLNGSSFRIFVFVGANQTKVPLDFARELQKLGADATYVQISGNGPNALDFHIAFTVGEISKLDPDAYLHIVSRDTGFDPLIDYARSKGILVQRSREIAEIPFLKLSNAKPLAERVDAVVRNLASRGSGRPRKVRTLKNTIHALFLKTLAASELDGIVTALQAAGYVVVEGDNVTYRNLASADQR